jgi:Rieske Fe-S protein
LIGPYPDRPHQYIITGASGNGMTHGTLGARLLTDLITGVENPWAKAYDPARTPMAVKEFLQLGVTAASSYARIVTAGKSESTVVETGSGEILDTEDGKLAVYRDPSGHVHRLSAACTHRGCIVAWNTAEQTWDCPCHGSRFAPNGELLTGPATTSLEPATKPAEAAAPQHPAD